MLTVTQWRLTCKLNYQQASTSLRRSLVNILRAFVPSPHSLLNIVTRHHAVFGGEVALAFMLRDATYVPGHLDIYTSDFEFDAVCDAILDDHCLRELIGYPIYTNNTVFDALCRLVSCTLTICTTQGKIIYIHQSYTSSAVAPISRASCTALSNFVTAFSFGCSHPRLTFQRRALLADLDFSPSAHHEPQHS
ncbi:hypothetical protein LXA43DRAFT_905165 [Ganoderma leucocontextum]|nr:hypothetical protein LXA43DRAFT_905165 [Ganoderma leucocontextum]